MSIGDDGTNADFWAAYGSTAPQPGGYVAPEMPPLQPMAMGTVPMAGQLPGAGVVDISADERKFRAADTDGDGMVSEQEAQDYLTYHAAADTDGDGQIDLKELVRFLKPIEDDMLQRGEAQQMQLAALHEQRRQQLEQLEQLRRQLASLGVSDAEMAEAAGAKGGGGSRACAIM